MTSTTFNEEQRRAIEAGGVVFVSAGAGTGKTRVLVERFARTVLERNGFVRYGVAPSYLKIAGRWQDHVMFAKLAEEHGRTPQ